MNLTFDNDARPGDTGYGQNMAVSTYGKRQVFLHCKMISWQDTYYTGSYGRTYLKKCWNEGAVDDIFGPATAVFDSCQIHTVRSGGYHGSLHRGQLPECFLNRIPIQLSGI